MDFQHHYNKKPYKGESGGGPTLVDRAGYVSTERRIKALLQSGQRLQQMRREQFDAPDGNVDQITVDPTRAADFSLADASVELRSVQDRLAASQAAQKASGEAEKAAAEESAAEGTETA